MSHPKQPKNTGTCTSLFMHTVKIKTEMLVWDQSLFMSLIKFIKFFFIDYRYMFSEVVLEKTKKFWWNTLYSQVNKALSLKTFLFSTVFDLCFTCFRLWVRMELSPWVTASVWLTGIESAPSQRRAERKNTPTLVHSDMVGAAWLHNIGLSLICLNLIYKF